MRLEPNIDELKLCISKLAVAMNMKPLPPEKSANLINHVLFDESYGSISGKKAWSSMQNTLITEKEMRNLIMAHSATKIAYFNKMAEPSSIKYDLEYFVKLFDLALYGRDAKLFEWELNTA